MDELKQKIGMTGHNLSLDYIQRAVLAMKSRAQRVITLQGGHFK